MAAMVVAKANDTQNQAWSADTSRFGFKMLQKMGWSEGKGLGVNEDGATGHIKTKKKDNSRGLGADVGQNDRWDNTMGNFNGVLSKLASADSPAAAEPGKKKKKRKGKKEKKEKADGASKGKKKRRREGEQSQEDGEEQAAGKKKRRTKEERQARKERREQKKKRPKKEKLVFKKRAMNKKVSNYSEKALAEIFGTAKGDD